jgi:hypothetical protein
MSGFYKFGVKLKDDVSERIMHLIPENESPQMVFARIFGFWKKFERIQPNAEAQRIQSHGRGIVKA